MFYPVFFKNLLELFLISYVRSGITSKPIPHNTLVRYLKDRGFGILIDYIPVFVLSFFYALSRFPAITRR